MIQGTLISGTVLELNHTVHIYGVFFLPNRNECIAHLLESIIQTGDGKTRTSQNREKEIRMYVKMSANILIERTTINTYGIIYLPIMFAYIHLIQHKVLQQPSKVIYRLKGERLTIFWERFGETVGQIHNSIIVKCVFTFYIVDFCRYNLLKEKNELLFKCQTSNVHVAVKMCFISINMCILLIVLKQCTISYNQCTIILFEMVSNSQRTRDRRYNKKKWLLIK